MPVPDFQSIMLPMARFIEDGGEHKLGDIIIDQYTVKRMDQDYFELEG